MAALLVALGIMSVMMSIAMPSWRHMVQREKEAELVFRGEQYARAVGLFQRKYGGAFPPNVDILVEQRFLRRKYKDPVTNDDFQILFQSAAQRPGVGGAAATTTQRPGVGVGGQATPGAAAGSAAGGEPATSADSPATDAARGTLGARGGITGVASKSKATSIRVYKGRSQYNEWAFVYTPVTPQGGTGGDQRQRPGMRTRPGQNVPRVGRPGGTSPGTTPTTPPPVLQSPPF